MPEVRLIAALDDENSIAKNQQIPWRIPTDQKYFKEKLATGPVVMGVKTYISNGRKPFGNFKNTVFSRDNLVADNVAVAKDAVGFFEKNQAEIWVAGGGQIFELALPYATKLYIIRVKGEYGCDVFFPEFEGKFKLENAGPWQQEDGYEFQFQTWVRK